MFFLNRKEAAEWQLLKNGFERLTRAWRLSRLCVWAFSVNRLEIAAYIRTLP